MASKIAYQLASILALASVSLVSACSGSVDAEVDEIYRNYAKAVANGRGSEAAKFASRTSIEHFADLRNRALWGGYSARSMTLYDEVAIYYLRAKYQAETLRSFTEWDVMNILINSGLVGVPDMEKLRVVDVRFEGDKAWGRLPTDEADTIYQISFHRERGKWKVETLPLRRSRDQVLTNRIVSYGRSRDDVIDEILKSVGVREGLSPRLFNPMLEKNS